MSGFCEVCGRPFSYDANRRQFKLCPDCRRLKRLGYLDPAQVKQPAQPSIVDESVPGGRDVDFRYFVATYGNRRCVFLAEAVKETDDPRVAPYTDLLGVGYSNDTSEDRAKHEAEWAALGMGEKKGGYAVDRRTHS